MGSFQSQRGIGRIMALLFPFVVVVVALQVERSKNTIDRDLLPPFALLTRLGLIAGIDALGSSLQQIAHQGVGRLEEGGAHQPFELLDGHAIGLAGLEAAHQLADFLLLGEEKLWSGVFFFEHAASCSRVSAMTNWAYCSVSSWNCA